MINEYDEDTYIDIEAQYKVFKNDDGTYSYIPREQERIDVDRSGY